MKKTNTTENKFNDIQEIVDVLHEINFGKKDGIIHIKDDYSVTEYLGESNSDNKHPIHKEISGYCVECDSDCNTSKINSVKIENEEYRLQNISHGTHTFDFLAACGLDSEKTKNLIIDKSWKTTPVLFLMENPSINYYDEDENIRVDLYQEINYKPANKDYNKKPSQQWYWIHNSFTKDDQESFITDKFLTQQQYGKMVFSLITQYKLGNAYLTNAIKCGMNTTSTDENGKEKYLNTSWYNPWCLQKCLTTLLQKEIMTLCKHENRIIVFAFGKNAYNLVSNFFENQPIYNQNQELLNYQLVLLPHPSNYHINDVFRKHILKGIITETLEKEESTYLPFGNAEIKSKIIYILKRHFYPIAIKEGKHKKKKHLSVIIEEKTDTNDIHSIKIINYENNMEQPNLKEGFSIAYDFISKNYTEKKDNPLMNKFEECISEITQI